MSEQPPEERIIEECAELIQDVQKAKRFGWTNWHPEDKDKIPNWSLVVTEMSHVSIQQHRLAKLIRTNFLKEESDERNSDPNSK